MVACQDLCVERVQGCEVGDKHLLWLLLMSTNTTYYTISSTYTSRALTSGEGEKMVLDALSVPQFMPCSLSVGFNKPKKILIVRIFYKKCF